MKQPIRFFSIGLFTATIVILIVYSIFNGGASNEKVDLTVDEMIEAIETDGYRVVSEEDYITYTVNKDIANQNAKEDNKTSSDNAQKDSEKVNKDENNKKEPTKSEEPEEDKEVTTYTIKVKQGMMPETIAEQLENNNIIESATSFAKYLEDNGYSPYVQIGSFKVSSEMSKKELAEKITKNRRP